MRGQFHVALFLVSSLLFLAQAVGYTPMNGRFARMDTTALGLSVLSVALMPW